MIYKLKQTFAVILTLVLFVGCRDEEAFVESKEYHEEELKVYEAVFNEIADTSFYYRKLKENDVETGVFFLLKE